MSAVKVHLYDDTTLKASPVVSGGAWSQASVSLAAGMHILKAKAEDAAGNLSGFSAVKRIKTGVTTTPYCVLLDDTGQSASDNITNDNTPQIKCRIDLDSDIPTGATSVHGDSVLEFKLWKKTGTDTYTLVATLDNPTYYGDDHFEETFQFVDALSDGDHQFCVSWKDTQGNESAKGDLLTITIDTQAPAAPTIQNIGDGQVFVGTSLTVSGSAS